MTSFPAVAKALAEAALTPIARIAPATRLDELDVDSLSITEMIFDLEDQFGVELGNGTPKLVTVQDIVDLIDRAVTAKAAAQ